MKILPGLLDVAHDVMLSNTFYEPVCWLLNSDSVSENSYAYQVHRGHLSWPTNNIKVTACMVCPQIESENLLHTSINTRM